MYEYTKICPECGKEKPLNKFYAATDSKKRRQCKTCWRRWRNAQPDMQQLRALAAERARHKTRGCNCTTTCSPINCTATNTKP